MQDSKEKGNDSGAPKASCPNGKIVFLLLLIGFLVGLSVGFYTKDYAVRQCLQLMGSTEQGPIKGKADSEDSSDGKTEVIKKTDAVEDGEAKKSDLKADEDKDDEEKKDDKKKDEEKPVPVAA